MRKKYNIRISPAAGLLDIPVNTVYRWIRLGLLSASKKKGFPATVVWQELEELVAQWRADKRQMKRLKKKCDTKN